MKRRVRRVDICHSSKTGVPFLLGASFKLTHYRIPSCAIFVIITASACVPECVAHTGGSSMRPGVNAAIQGALRPTDKLKRVPRVPSGDILTSGSFLPA